MSVKNLSVRVCALLDDFAAAASVAAAGMFFVDVSTVASVSWILSASLPLSYTRSAQGYFTAASPSLTQRRSNFDRSATFGTTLLQSRVARLCLWAPRSSEIVAISPKVLEYGMVL